MPANPALFLATPRALDTQTDFGRNSESVWVGDHQFVIDVWKFDALLFVNGSNADQSEEVVKKIFEEELVESGLVGDHEVGTHVDLEQEEIELLVEKHVEAEEFEVVVLGGAKGGELKN